MKKNTPALLGDRIINIISLQRLFASTRKRVSIIIILTFFYSAVTAQNGNSVTPAIKEIKTYISSLKTGDKKTKVSATNSQYIQNLVFGIQPSIYLNSGNEKIYGDKPVKLFTDISSLATISFSNLSNDDIEIVAVRIVNTNDLNSKIDLAIFSNFTTLKYIYIISSINASEQNIANMFIHYNNQYSIFYKIEIAE